MAFFSTLIVAYLTFMGKDMVGPTPAEALSLPLVIRTTICLLSSSVVIHLAERVARARTSNERFCLWLAATIALGIGFLLGTAFEWRELITRASAHDQPQPVRHHVLHPGRLPRPARHRRRVAMLIVLALSLGREVTEQHSTGVELVAWYWHFVDGVWIVVFLVVYVASRSGVA